MKPAPFEYFAPTTVEEALHLLGEHGYGAKPLAGGQSLIPTMNFRLAQPSVLVDLNTIPELSYIRPADNGGVRIGAMTRQSRLERDTVIAERAPLVHATMPHIAHVQIRNRGTLGGSLAHADPAAELPAVALALNARLRVRNQSGSRWIAAEDFFVDLFTTALEPGDLLVEIELAPRPPRSGWAVREVARRSGDYALLGVATQVVLDGAGSCQDLRLVFFSTGGPDPTLAPSVADGLRGEAPTDARIQAAVDAAVAHDIDPSGDIHASTAYRRHLAGVVARQALHAAFERAKNGRD
jgi:carbon-monoxide dehydrogenase medium subunit